MSDPDDFEGESGSSETIVVKVIVSLDTSNNKLFAINFPRATAVWATVSPDF